MDAKNDKSQFNRWVLAGIFGIISSIAVPTVLSIWQQQSKGITLWRVTSRSLLTSEVGANLTILFNESSVELPWVYTLRLTNTGSLPIESGDVEKPLTLGFPESRIVHAEITTKEPHDVRAHAIHISDELILSHGLLNPGDWFEADVLFDGKPSEPAISYRVTGLNSPAQITELHSGADEVFMAWVPPPLRYFVVTVIGLGAIFLLGLGVYGFVEAIAPFVKMRNVRLSKRMERLLSEISSGEISESLRSRVARQVWRELPPELDSEVQAIIEGIPPNELLNDPSVLADQILQRLPDELEERMQAKKEILVENLNLKALLAHELWKEFPPPTDDIVREVIISAPFDPRSTSHEEILRSTREALGKIPIRRRIAWGDAGLAFVSALVGTCFAVVTTECWRQLL